MDVEEINDLIVSNPNNSTKQGDSTVTTSLTWTKIGPSLNTLFVEYIDDLPEYPATHPQGYSYVVAAGGRSQAEMEQMVQDIQYSRKLKCGLKRPVNCSFFDCKVKKWTWGCSGVYACEFLNSSLQSLHHTSVDENIWQEIKNHQKDDELLASDSAKQNAYNYYRSKLVVFKKGHACIDQVPTCKPVFKRYTQMNANGSYASYIGCVNDTSDTLTTHHRMAVQGQNNIDLLFLENLFNNNILPATEECGVFRPLSSRQKFCDRDHIQGIGRLKQTRCDVVFNALVPVDIGQCPYILFSSHGVHKHPPPLPTKAPVRILQQISQLIQQAPDFSTTRVPFVRSPQLKTFCQEHNAWPLAEIQSYFSNLDQVTALMQKQRLLSYPDGQDINSLIFLKNTYRDYNDYIQEYYQDTGGNMVFCGSRDQIRVLSRLESFKIDVAYNQIQSKDIKEVLFSTLTNQAKPIILLRVYTTVDSTEGYYLLFGRTFDLIQKVTGEPVLFDPLHGSGFHGIIVDMESKHYKGLGQYLHELDPYGRDITWQLQHIIMFCRVHFERSIVKAIGIHHQRSPVWTEMMGLPECQSETHYDTLIDLLIKHEIPEVQNWARQKKCPIIKSGLSKACSKISPFRFDKLLNTHAVEHSHEEADVCGKYLTLTNAVGKSMRLDNQSLRQYRNPQSFTNYRQTSNTRSMEVNYLRHMSLGKGLKRRRSSTSSSEEILSSPEQVYQRSPSQHFEDSGDTESVGSTSSNVRYVPPTNTLTLDERRQELELRRAELDVQMEEVRVRRLELDVQMEEVQTRRLELVNDKLELDLMQQRISMQKSHANRNT